MGIYILNPVFAARHVFRILFSKVSADFLAWLATSRDQESYCMKVVAAGSRLGSDCEINPVMDYTLQLQQCY